MPENPLITSLRDQRDAEQKTLDGLGEKIVSENRSFTEDEDATFKATRSKVIELDERIGELVDLDKRSAEAAEARVAAGATGQQHVVTNEPNPVYRKGDNAAPSFFMDLAAVNTGRVFTGTVDEARTRLAAAQETRAGDMTTVAGAGGEFAPPLWAIEDFVQLARPGRPTADLVVSRPLPPGVSSINLPKVGGTQPTAGTAVGVQQTQNSGVTDTAMTTTSVSSGVITLSGAQIISLQLLEQTPIPFDEVILQDLARAYAAELDTQVLYGTNANGQLNGLVNIGSAQAFTSASPAVASSTTANSLYYSVGKAWASIVGSLYTMTPDALVMHPRRWAWIVGSVDANARPFVIPEGPAYNPAAVGDLNTPQSRVGTFAGVPVYVDANISTTANSATNQDEIYMLVSNQLWLYETPVQSASFDATYANNLSMLFRVHGYAAFIPNRYTAACVPIRGTGLVAP